MRQSRSGSILKFGFWYPAAAWLIALAAAARPLPRK